MELGAPEPLAASEIHGFHTTADLDIGRLFDDASNRWLRPNEIHALLSNYNLLKIQPQPVRNPESGSILLFDRHMLRNFRKDGHNWRKKKDGKTVQEAHEKLKIGNDERIHVYYARGEDDQNFYRRCYWLLDRSLERIVLVHYRQTAEDNPNQKVYSALDCKDQSSWANSLHNSPVTPMSSTSASNVEESGSCLRSREEVRSAEDSATISGYDKPTEIEGHDLTIDMITRFDWASLELQTSNDPNVPCHQELCSQDFRDHVNDGDLGFDPSNAVDQLVTCCSQDTVAEQGSANISGIQKAFCDENLQTQNSFSQWDFIVDDTPGLLSFGELDQVSVALDSQTQATEEAFIITDTSPAWSYSDEETKILVVGYFHESHKQLENSSLYLVLGDTYVPAELVQHGVYRSRVTPRTPGLTNLYLTLDKQLPISKIMDYEVRPTVNALKHEEESAERDLEVIIRLIRLLFSTSSYSSIQSNMKVAKRFLSATAPSLEKDWTHLLKSVRSKGASFSSVSRELFDLVLKTKVQEWLSLKLAEGRKTTELDSQGLGVLHLCAIQDFTWAAHLFKSSGLSIDFRDVYGWTALHWAAYSGRVKMVAALLSSGANPSLVTDPTPEFPGGCTASDLASKAGFEGLAAYLAEKALTAHFAAMTLSGNASRPSAPAWGEKVNPENMESGSNEQEVLLKYSLAAYRNAADAANRIHSALRDRSLRLRVKAAESSNSQSDAALIVAALKIQRAYRNHNSQKMIKAAARIQGTFRTWQARKNFLAMRRHAIKIQAAFRGLLVRKQYRKIIWSVGVLEKAVLRWRMKRKGLRGLQIESGDASAAASMEKSSAEEEYFRVSREQAEERVNRSVIRVQAMFRSYRSQQEYRKMKLAHDQAQFEYDEFARYRELYDEQGYTNRSN
ncbi:calmodulin-binding transcription activator isoform X2 [Wolffia australiana]